MHPIVLWGSRARVGTATLVAGVVLLGGCLPANETRLSPLWGCALEDQELTNLRVRARGDLPPADTEQLLLDRGQASLDELPEGIEGITVEGLFGESVVLAVGRTTRLPERGLLPVYFAPPDQLCPLQPDGEGEQALEPRTAVAAAVNSAGDVLAVGGQGSGDSMLDEIVLLRDVDDVPRVVESTLSDPAVGQALVPIGARAFVLIGGALGDRAQASGDVWRLDVDPDQPVVSIGTAQAVEIDGVPITGRAFHGAVALPEGGVLVQGGCATVERGECLPSEDTVLRSGYRMRPQGSRFVFEPVPPMMDARYGHSLLVSRDGVVFAVGGRDADGQGVRDVEVLLPQSQAWARYGPALFEVLDRAEIVGATLLEGGLLVFALSNGEVWRVDQNHVERFTQWCEDGSPCFLPPVDTFPIRRSLHTLWGERVLADRFVLPVGELGRDGSDAIDLSAQEPGQQFRPPGPRLGAATIALNDGTVLSIGGRVPASGALAVPTFTRFRPALDGPDEGTPDVSSPNNGSLIVHDRALEPPRISAAPQTLILEPDPDRPSDFATTWVHVRGFRSRRFVLEGVIEALNGSPGLRFVFSRGAVARTEVEVAAQGVRLFAREGDGSAVEVSCGDTGLEFAGVGQSVRVLVSPGSIEVRTGTELLARCPWAGSEPVAVGLGAVGSGTIRATSLRLSRN